MRRFCLTLMGMVVFLLLSTSQIIFASEYTTYKVKSGDSLWVIAKNYKVGIKEIQRLNKLENHLIHPGQSLKIPHSNKASIHNKEDKNDKVVHTEVQKIHNKYKHVVKKGDTLWELSIKYKSTVQEIKKRNGLKSNVLRIGQVLMISQTQLASRNLGYYPYVQRNFYESARAFSENDLKWLANIIEAEAGNQPYKGKVAVGSVVINRVEHPSFPDSIKAVIFQKNQFSPVANGRIYRVKPDQESYRAAEAALNGEDPTKGALYFYNPRIATSNWIRTREVVVVIGHHNFAY